LRRLIGSAKGRQESRLEFEREESIMGATRVIAGFAVCVAVFAGGMVAAAPARAQAPPSMPSARIIVTGEGSVTAPPDSAEISSGVTTRAKTAKEATDANSKALAALNTALQNAGIAPGDIQTSRFSLAPVYGAPQANNPPPLVGYAVSNELSIRIRQLSAVGTMLDALIASGATDAGSVQFLHSDLSKVLDQARQGAMADAKRKAELYAQAAGLKLGSVAWVTEEPAYVPPMPMLGARAAVASAPVSIAPGEDTLRVQITVGFETGG
jgi:hypothetical protein